jgi:DNA (cytosine-5)-methyltransferase 1
MNHLDLFSGIGGFRLALDIAGIPIDHSYHSDIEPYACKVYSQHYPASIGLGDIKTINGHELRARHPEPWAITGGFPCQDLSDAGKKKGLEGARSGLWFEMLRVIDELRPEVVIAENVAALLYRGMPQVLSSLDAIGYDAQWRTLSASQVGAIHQRKRLWITAYPRHANGDGLDFIKQLLANQRDLGNNQHDDKAVDALITRIKWEAIKAEGTIYGEPFVSGGTDGLSERVDRIKGLGNAIVPQCAARVITDFIDG